MEIYLKAYLVILLRAIYRYLLLFLLWHVWFEGKHTTRLLKNAFIAMLLLIDKVWFCETK